MLAHVGTLLAALQHGGQRHTQKEGESMKAGVSSCRLTDTIIDTRLSGSYPSLLTHKGPSSKSYQDENVGIKFQTYIRTVETYSPNIFLQSAKKIHSLLEVSK